MTGDEITAFCTRVLCAPDLATKLSSPRSEAKDARPRSGQVTAEGTSGDGALPARPARGPGLELGSGAAPLPRRRALHDPAARALALARFAHHELQAVELFAWAILRWPRVPSALRSGWFGVLQDEQRHAGLYLDRVQALGFRFESFAPHSDYMWRHVSAFDRAEDGPAAFVAAMGLTLEQANLDFSALWRDAFEAAGDPASAAVCAEVHRDEIGHVALAARWLRALRPEPDEVARYEASVPFPLGAARAKGRRFDAEARHRAQLDVAFIEHVRTARSTQERGLSPRED